MAIISRLLPSNTGGTTGNLRFAIADALNEKRVSLQARQIPTVDISPCLTPGAVLTCQFYRRYNGKLYYRSHPDTDPDAWTAPNPFNGILLYPDKPVNEWFNIPLTLSGAQMPTAHTPGNITVRHAGALAQSLSDYVFEETPPSSADESTVPKIRIVDTPSRELVIVGSVTVGDGVPTAYGTNSAHLNAGGTLHYGGSNNYHPSAVYAVYDFDSGSWSITTDMWESFRYVGFYYDINATF